MFHDAGAQLPCVRRHEHAGAGRRGRRGTRSSATAARSTSRRVTVRAGIKFAELAPGLSDRLSERLGSRAIADDLARGQAAKR